MTTENTLNDLVKKETEMFSRSQTIAVAGAAVGTLLTCASAGTSMSGIAGGVVGGIVAYKTAPRVTAEVGENIFGDLLVADIGFILGGIGSAIGHGLTK